MQLPVIQLRWLSETSRPDHNRTEPLDGWRFEDRHAVAVALACAFLATMSLGFYVWLGQQDPVVQSRPIALTSWVVAAPGLILALLAVSGGMWLKGRTMTAQQGSSRSRLADDVAPSWGKDRLTGLLNRPAFMTFAEDAFSYFQRYNRRVAVLMVEVDDLPVTDRGPSPETEDLVRRHIADVLDLSLRKTDKISRFGADRFAILLREITEADALMLSARMQTSVAALGVRCGEHLIPVTVSIGVALVSRGDSTLDALLARTDLALATARSGGPNSLHLEPATEPNATDQAARSPA